MSLRQHLGTQQIKGPAIAEEAGLIDGHGLGDCALQLGALDEPQEMHQFVEPRHPVPVQQSHEA